MKPIFRPERLEPSIAPGDRLADIIAALAARMSEVQRHAFQVKMADLDRQQRQLSALTMTLGSA